MLRTDPEAGDADLTDSRDREFRRIAEDLCPLADRFGRILADLSPLLRALGSSAAPPLSPMGTGISPALVTSNPLSPDYFPAPEHPSNNMLEMSLASLLRPRSVCNQLFRKLCLSSCLLFDSLFLVFSSILSLSFPYLTFQLLPFSFNTRLPLWTPRAPSPPPLRAFRQPISTSAQPPLGLGLRSAVLLGSGSLGIGMDPQNQGSGMPGLGGLRGTTRLGFGGSGGGIFDIHIAVLPPSRR